MKRAIALGGQTGTTAGRPITRTAMPIRMPTMATTVSMSIATTTTTTSVRASVAATKMATAVTTRTEASPTERSPFWPPWWPESLSTSRFVRVDRGEELIMRMMAIVLLLAGVLGLVYGGFSYTRETHEAKVGPLEVSISEKQRVNVPMWAG